MFIFGCVGSPPLCEGPLQLRRAGATLHCGARAPHHCGPPRRGAEAPDAQAQQLRLTGPAAPRHAGSSQTRAQTHAPCISRQTPNHCATREAPYLPFYSLWRVNYSGSRPEACNPPAGGHGYHITPAAVCSEPCQAFFSFTVTSSESGWEGPRRSGLANHQA